MGWFWGASDDDEGNGKGKDPLRNLDPTLRDFLAKESPVKYNASNPPAEPQPSPPTNSQSKHSSSPQTPNISPSSSTTDSAPSAPSQSLYKDGRYAHLWKTYQSQAEVENAGKSDQEKIQDVLDGYKYRKAEIGRAALENCALEQWEVNECFRNGGWASRMTMCRAENRGLERCYLMQAKFLKALGYLSTFERPPEVDEQIQMHADTLYHRMLAQEASIEAAKIAGSPIPSYPPLLSTTARRAASTPSLDTNKIKPEDLPSGVQAAFKKRLEGLTDEQRDLEERAIKAEIQAGEQVAGRLGIIYDKQKEEKRVRKEEGRETVGDKLSSIFRFR